MNECSKKCKELDVECPFRECRSWVNYPEDQNCSLISMDKSFKGTLSLREVADRLGISFVRVKQIETEALEKLRTRPEFEEIKELFQSCVMDDQYYFV